MSGYMDLRRPRVYRRSSVGLVLNKGIWISIDISLKFVLKGQINNISGLVQIMAWRRPGDKPLSEPILSQWNNSWDVSSCLVTQGGPSGSMQERIRGHHAFVVQILGQKITKHLVFLLCKDLSVGQQISRAWISNDMAQYPVGWCYLSVL